MIFLFRVSIAVILMFSSLSVFAGKAVGNGGHGLKCGSTIEVVDFYEAQRLNGFTLDFGSAGTQDEALDMIVSRLQRIDPLRARELSEGISSFFANAQFVNNTWIQPTDDASLVAIPNGCQLVQLINRRVSPAPFQKKYLVDEDLWARLDFKNQAMLITHELLYERMETRNETAANARFYNSLLWSDVFAGLTPTQNFIESAVLGFDKANLHECSVEVRVYGSDLIANLGGRDCPIEVAANTYSKVDQVIIRDGSIWYIRSRVSPFSEVIKTYTVSGGSAGAFETKFDEHGHVTDFSAEATQITGTFADPQGHELNCRQEGSSTLFELDLSGRLLGCTFF